MLKNSSLEKLHAKKNLLAFSAGVDSSALFFILQEYKIDFDIAIVNYNIRSQSKNELDYAYELADKYKIKCYTLDAEKIENNFEANARKIRYDFFEELIQKYKYDNLITAHHLGDRFEWMLMQFCKGAGCAELSGMQTIHKRQNYTLLRPLLHLDKQELLAYLDKNNIKYFIDESNNDETIKRNEFRHQYSKPLLEKYLNGIKKSFEYIDKDRESLVYESDITILRDFAYFTTLQTPRANIYIIDKYLKSLGLMISSNERALLETQESSVVGRKFLVTQNKNYVFIAPYKKIQKTLESQFKDECRKLKIQPKLRPYLFENQDIYREVKKLLSAI